eukprot:351114-Chlamydomonas_euryale.AAC.2
MLSLSFAQKTCGGSQEVQGLWGVESGGVLPKTLAAHAGSHAARRWLACLRRCAPTPHPHTCVPPSPAIPAPPHKCSHLLQRASLVHVVNLQLSVLAAQDDVGHASLGQIHTWRHPWGRQAQRQCEHKCGPPRGATPSEQQQQDSQTRPEALRSVPDRTLRPGLKRYVLYQTGLSDQA